MSFADKVVLITGGSSGIGAATAKVFASKGANVVIVSRNEADLKLVADQCEAMGKRALYIEADIANDDKAKEIIKKVIDTFGKLDILVNNAAITAAASIMQGNLLEAYDNVMNINLRAAIHLTILATPWLIETKGNIVNVSSVNGKSYFKRPSVMAYAISKAGLDHFTRGAALELLKKGVRVNTVTPGITRTNILKNNGINKTWEEVQAAYKIERITEPEEVADLICFLASDRAKSITGANYVMDNGSLLYA